MAAQIILVLATLVLAVSSSPLGLEQGYSYSDLGLENSYDDHQAPSSYSYKYGVHDAHSGDIKSASESRHGDLVTGEYSLVQPDGATRLVKYTADKHNGFNAQVYLSKAHGLY